VKGKARLTEELDDSPPPLRFLKLNMGRGTVVKRGLHDLVRRELLLLLLLLQLLRGRELRRGLGTLEGGRGRSWSVLTEDRVAMGRRLRLLGVRGGEREASEVEVETGSRGER
jgi:hypothetical protein